MNTHKGQVAVDINEVWSAAVAADEISLIAPQAGRVVAEFHDRGVLGWRAREGGFLRGSDAVDGITADAVGLSVDENDLAEVIIAGGKSKDGVVGDVIGSGKRRGELAQPEVGADTGGGRLVAPGIDGVIPSSGDSAPRRT